jgi:protein-S-isoprenylcysteine O-methyltransferase Ste14
MHRPSLKKIFGIGPLGALISLALLAVAAWIDRSVGFGTIGRRVAALRVAGGLIILLGLGLHSWSFLTLRDWWRDDRLCTRGPFRYVRHPMYAAWISLIVPGVVLILNRWAYVLWMVALHPLWHVLVRREEGTMARIFGETYRRYASRTGRFLPRLRRRLPE